MAELEEFDQSEHEEHSTTENDSRNPEASSQSEDEGGGGNNKLDDVQDEYSNKEKQFLRRLDAFFEAHALKPMSKKIAFSYTQTMATDTEGTFDRVRPWLLNQVNGVRVLPDGFSSWQKGCSSLVPGLRATPFWDPEAFSWFSELQAQSTSILAELLALKGQTAFVPYRAPSSASAQPAPDGIGSVSHDAGDWSVFYLLLHNMDFDSNADRCPVTTSVLKGIRGQYSHAFFSALAPLTHITKHHGPTNKKLRCHFPLVVPEGQCRLRVGEETRTLEAGKPIVFDDSFEHEAWNDDPGATRIVLIFDVWHPDLQPKEIKFMEFLQNSALKAEKNMVSERDREASEQRRYDNFFSVIEAAKSISVDDERVF